MSGVTTKSYLLTARQTQIYKSKYNAHRTTNSMKLSQEQYTSMDELEKGTPLKHPKHLNKSRKT